MAKEIGQISYNFYSGLKSLNYKFILLYLRYMWWRGLAENVRIPSYVVVGD